MRLGRFMIELYRSRFRWTSTGGIETCTDPKVVTIWAYFGLFGIALSWSEGGWLYAWEADQKRAWSILMAAPEPNVKSKLFSDAWDEFDREDDRIDANKYRNGG